MQSALRSATANPKTGKFPLTWFPHKSTGEVVPYKCGRCPGCLIRRTQDWAVKAVHEASLYRKNCFVTLTYSDRHLPFLSDLKYGYRDFQLFMKNLRYRFGKMRYLVVGEYGEQRGRPHFHALLFNCDFPDRIAGFGSNGNRLDRSAMLDGLWSDSSGEQLGFCSVGDVTYQSAAYCARYVLKKGFGQSGGLAYETVDPSTGEVIERKREFNRSSQSLGRGWLEQFHGQVYPSDFVVLNGQKFAVPKTYDRIFEEMDSVSLERVKAKRLEAVKAQDLTKDQLQAMKVNLLARLTRFGRDYENGA